MPAKRLSARALLLALMSPSLSATAQAGTKLTVISPPEGGRAVYGRTPGEEPRGD